MQAHPGYGIDTVYTFNYFRELNPLFAEAVLLHAGFAPARPVAACELGFGLGLSVAINQAASGVEMWGTDFSPAQVAVARGLVGAEGQARLSEADFATFCSRQDLPDFDMIAAHGVWTCVSDENRRIILDFVKRKLRVGGVFYVSYNTEAGWSPVAPLRRLLRDHVARMSAPAIGELPALQAAILFAQELFAGRCGYAEQNPRVNAILQDMAGQDLRYPAHEYLTEHWTPMAFTEVARLMGGAQLSYACSARIIDQIPELGLLPQHRALLQSIPDATFRESVRDLLTGRSFRRDYWVKGRPTLSAEHRDRSLRDQRVVLVEAPDSFDIAPETPFGPITLPRALFQPLIDIMADHKPHRLEDLAQQSRIEWQSMVKAVFILVHLGAVQPAHGSDETAAAVTSGTARINAMLAERADEQGDASCLASPIIGGACRIDPKEFAMLRAASTDPQPTERVRMLRTLGISLTG